MKKKITLVLAGIVVIGTLITGGILLKKGNIQEVKSTVKVEEESKVEIEKIETEEDKINKDEVEEISDETREKVIVQQIQDTPPKPKIETKTEVTTNKVTEKVTEPTTKEQHQMGDVKDGKTWVDGFGWVDGVNDGNGAEEFNWEQVGDMN